MLHDVLHSPVPNVHTVSGACSVVFDKTVHHYAHKYLLLFQNFSILSLKGNLWGAFGAYGGGVREMCTWFLRGNLKERASLENLDVDGTILLE